MSLTEIQPPINHLFVSNEKCLHWKAEKYEEDAEVYKVRRLPLPSLTCVN